MSEKTLPKHGDLCPTWLSGLLSNPVRRLLHNPEQILAGLVGPGQTVLDLGCGPGYFTLPMARLVEPTGRVFAVDVQPGMLEKVRARAEQQGLLNRLTLLQATRNGIGLDQPVDFALAFWMVHEMADPEMFLAEVSSLLKPGGRFLLVEPVMHVDAAQFARTARRVESKGFVPIAEPKVRISRAILYQKPPRADQGAA